MSEAKRLRGLGRSGSVLKMETASIVARIETTQRLLDDPDRALLFDDVFFGAPGGKKSRMPADMSLDVLLQSGAVYLGEHAKLIEVAEGAAKAVDHGGILAILFREFLAVAYQLFVLVGDQKAVAITLDAISALEPIERRLRVYDSDE
jgi:hypothetical protein